MTSCRVGHASRRRSDAAAGYRCLPPTAVLCSLTADPAVSSRPRPLSPSLSGAAVTSRQALSRLPRGSYVALLHLVLTDLPASTSPRSPYLSMRHQRAVILSFPDRASVATLWRVRNTLPRTRLCYLASLHLAMVLSCLFPVPAHVAGLARVQSCLH